MDILKCIAIILFFLNVIIGDVFSIPLSTFSSLVVSSTEKSTPEDIINNNEEDKSDDAPSVPKIYEMRVDTNVTNRFATTLITSKVKNLAKKAQEATFAVVLPDTAYISSFVMEIDGKTYQAYVKEKQEAKQIYDQAVQSGQAAGHVAVNARDSNRFTVSVNVEPQSKATFRLVYEELLQRRNERYELVLNLNPGQPIKDLNVQVAINETRPLKFVKAPPLRSGNEIATSADNSLDPSAKIDIINATSAIVKFNPDIEKQKQFGGSLGGDKDNGLSGQFVVQYDVERDPQGGEVLVKDGYFVHFFAPEDKTPLPKQVVFVLDTSGSMGGQRIAQLKEAMKSILSELKKEDVFNIVEFGSNVKVWNVDKGQVQYTEGELSQYANWGIPPPPGHIISTTEKIDQAKQELPPAYEATEENVKKAKEVVDKLQADGGTDIKTGLEVGLKLVAKNRDENKDNHQPMIIFLTDGEPTVGETNTETIIKDIQKANNGDKQVPIFSLSFGDGADRDFLQKISLKNLGFARHIYEAADASLQLQEFYKQISSPLLSDVTFKYVSKVEKITKTHFPIYFGGSELVVAGKIIDEGFAPSPVICRGPIGPIELIPKIENPIGALERLWAYLTVKQILEERDAADNKTELTKKALDLALKYSFVTDVSSLVVVKPNATQGDAVNTEDASSRPNWQNPHLLQASFGGAGFRPHSPSFSAPAANGGGAAFGFAGPPPPAYPTTPFIPHDFPPPISTTLAQESAEVEKTDLYATLKAKLPWLEKILGTDGILTSPPGGYKLSLESLQLQPECPKTPLNGTVAGVCKSLDDCPQVHSLLKEEKDFVDHVCFVDKVAGICCPKEQVSP